MTRLALIAGQGRLPGLLRSHLRSEGTDVTLFSPEGFGPEGLDAESFRIEHLGTLIARLQGEGYTRLCLAGLVRRPKLDPAMVDAATAPLVPRLLTAMGGGDDGLLRTVVTFFEEAGLTVVGAHDLMPGLLASAGNPPEAPFDADARRGKAILAALAPLDLCQSCVVADGHVLGIETIQGTEAMLDFVARTRDPDSSGGLFVKRAKPGQDLRVDMPSIGPDTIDQVARARLSGICVQAGHVLLLDREALERKAAKADLRLWAVP